MRAEKPPSGYIQSVPIIDQLRAARIARDLSIFQVAALARAQSPDVVGLQPTAMGDWENRARGRSPNPAQLDAWAAALGFEVILQPRAA